ncbi:MAG: triose-phosphate isomerase [Deltaproteobacteria bacterium]|nr:MAG: triose-phosphate isomerase [Deltaproteobacteria bacterium]
MRKYLVIGNWKMNFGRSESVTFLDEFIPIFKKRSDVEVGIAPPFTSLSICAEKLHGSSILLGAQNCHWVESGAYTGEISAGMLKELGCSFAIVGHSERRQLFGESDEGVNKRAAALLAADLTPVVCVGETLEERESGEAFKVVTRQLELGLAGISPKLISRVVIAYEPVWAIGTGKTASASEAQEVHSHIRKVISRLGGDSISKEVRILYGGSVNDKNAASLLGEKDIDGALVGGASLVAQKFASIAGFRV